MGMHASAALVFGIPIDSYDENDNVSPFWDEEEQYWKDPIDPDGLLTYRTHGDCGGYDEDRMILGIQGVPSFSTYEPSELTEVDPAKLVVSDHVIELGNKALDAAGFEGYDFASAKWWLVSSYG